MHIKTNYGPVRGNPADENGVLSFKGIPYAAPPVDALRFQPPQPPAAWAEERDCTERGPGAPQVVSEGPLAELLSVSVPGDDYLNLNVWTRDTGDKRPVMVYIHGGSFTSGSGADRIYDGGRFARDGVVLVTINYRLGADGFLWFGEGTPNLGLLDQIAALQWVRENISQFGGDPDNVTVFGESAGAMSVCTLLAMPAARGLFRRAIAESGAGNSVISPATARLIGKRLAEILGVEPNRAAIAEVPREQLIAAQTQLSIEVATKPDPTLWGEVALNLMPFEPIVDGELLPDIPLDRIVAGASADVEILIGTNSEEARLFLVPRGLVNIITEPLMRRAGVSYQLPPEAVDRYVANYPQATPGDLAAILMTDWFYWIPALRIAEAHPNTHVYEFGWRSNAFGGTLGACHALEIPFVFDNLDAQGLAPLAGGDTPQQLAEVMHKAWVDFATDGDPGWPAYRAEQRSAMRFDTESAIITDSRADERELWKDIR